MLVVDIGNSRASFGTFIDGQLRASFHILAEHLLDKQVLKDEVVNHLDDKLNFDPNNKFEPGDIYTASVNPSIDTILEELLVTYFDQPIKSLKWNMKKNITLGVENPQTLGLDRIANCIAAYQENKQSIIVIDMGSAITVDYVSGDGVFKGGAIAPGPREMLRSLVEKAPHLPTIELEKSDQVLGNNTVEAVKAGVYFGSAAMIEGLVSRMSSEDPKAKVILTGGFSELFTEELKIEHQLDETLTLRGIKYFADLN